jgi:glycosyltransferase involved in cell wall biosynthesis
MILAADRNRIAPYLFHLKPGADQSAPDCPTSSGSGHGGKTGAMTDLLDWLVSNRIDILHCHSFRPNLYARLAGAVLRPRLKIVAHYHNIYDDKWCDPQALSLERLLGAVTDARIAVSKSVAYHVADCLGVAVASIDVVGNAIDHDRLSRADRARGRARLGIAPEVPLIGLVGRVCRQKGPDTFVDAAFALLSQDPSLRFVLIGDIEDAALGLDLQTRISDAGQTEAIRFTGHCTDVADVLAALDVMAAPSRWEGFGLAILEAMFLGIPVVASYVDAIPDVVGGTATLVPPDDPKALFRAIEEALVTPRTDRTEQARQRARVASWDAAAAQVQAVYERIMG